MLSEKQKRPKVKEFAKFLVWVKENFLYTLKWIKTWWEFQKNIFLSVKVWKIWFVGAILTFWAFCFNILLGRQLPPKNHAVNHIHILALSLMISEIFIFESADSVKSGEQAGTFAVEYLYSTSASGLPHSNSP